MILLIIDEVIKYNHEFLSKFEGKDLSHIPRKRVAIVTCMDTRLVEFLEPAMGLKRGDAKIIKNAGNRITDDVLRSLVVAIYSLGAEEVIVVGHTECGMAGVDFDKLKTAMKMKGISEDVIESLKLEEWIGAIDNEEKNVLDGIKSIKSFEAIPDEIPVHGMIIDINTGEIKILHRDS